MFPGPQLQQMMQHHPCTPFAWLACPQFLATPYETTSGWQCASKHRFSFSATAIGWNLQLAVRSTTVR
jgi:hypothetical protein